MKRIIGGLFVGQSRRNELLSGSRAGMGMGMGIRERPCQALVDRSESNGPMDGGQMIFALVNVPRNDAIRSGPWKTGALL